MGYHNAAIHIDTVVAKNIGFTSEFFDNGTIYSKLPHGYFIVRIEPKTESAIDHMLQKIKEHGFLVRINKQRLGLEYVNEAMEKAGYISNTDPAGTVEYRNYKTVFKDGKKILQRI